jgi:hypothetical protein
MTGELVPLGAYDWRHPRKGENDSTLARSALCTATVRTDCVNYVYV